MESFEKNLHVDLCKKNVFDLINQAETVDNSVVCGNRIMATDQVGVRDAVVRPLLVEAEGEPQEYSRTSFICPDEGEKRGAGKGERGGRGEGKGDRETGRERKSVREEERKSEIEKKE